MAIPFSGEEEREAIDRVSALLCRGCEQAVAVVEEQWVGDHPARDGTGSGGLVYWRGVQWWPAPGQADLEDVIPGRLREAFTEGMKCLGANAPHAAVVMFRRTVEGIVRDKGSAKAKDQLDRNDLAGALAIMAKEQALQPALADWAGEIRSLGNTGAHFDPMSDVSAEQAQSLAQLVRQILRYLYEEPERVRQLRESRGLSEPDAEGG